MNEKRRRSGRPRASIRLKCKNKFSIKTLLFFQPITNFLTKVFQSRLDSKRGNKTVNKSFKKSVDSGGLRERERERERENRHGQDQNPLRRGWVYRPAPEAPRQGECRRGPRHFWNCLSRWASALRQDPP